jgi:hypothetical protein
MMFDLDAIMHNLIIAKLGKGIVMDDNPFHWLCGDGSLNPKEVYCLFCGNNIIDLGIGTDQHALNHIKEFNLIAFL